MPSVTVAGRSGRPSPERRSLPRERLLGLLPRIWEHRVSLVVAPAGSGKTTLLGQLSAAAAAPAAHILAEPQHSEEAALLSALERSLTSVLPGLKRGWRDVNDMAAALAGAVTQPTLLVVDDFHTLSGTPAEACFERLLARAPPGFAVVIASRSRPNLNWTRQLVSGALFEIDADDLRFRSWEIERLFRDVYEEPLPPRDIAILERRTEGWAAGLMLFHLATRGQPLAARRRALASLQTRWRLAREYLTRNVLDTLDEGLRTFLVETCVLTRLSGRLCDELIGRRGSADVLRELERKQLFTQELPDGFFRYHETLRLQLESVLVEQLTDADLKEQFRRAGLLLERDGAFADAVRAFCRGEAWDDLSRLLGRNGERFAGRASIWLDTLPAGVLRDDPWLLLALARQQRAAGRLAAAEASYRKAESRFAGAAEADLCRRERHSVSIWLEPAAPLLEDAPSTLRRATIRDPDGQRRQAARLDGADARLAEGVAALLAGRCRDARAILDRIADDPEQPEAAAAAAAVERAVASLLAGAPDGASAAERAAEGAARLGLTWLARIARAALALEGGADFRREAALARVGCAEEGDAWGCALCELAEGWGALRDGEPEPELLEDAADRFRALGAGALQAWTIGAHALALARMGSPAAAARTTEAAELGRMLAVAPAQALAALAAAELGAERSLDSPGEVDVVFPSAAARPAAAAFELRLFGELRLRVGGRRVELSGLKPQARSLFAQLALAAGRPVHREVLMETFWPGLDPERAAPNLHVLLSLLRRALEPKMQRAGSSLVGRQGEAYRLVIPEDAWVDTIEFERALDEAERAGDRRRALAAYAEALDLYAGELLPGEGPADWVVEERARRHAQAVEAGRSLAELLLESGRPRAAALVCERVLALDRNDDALWRLAIAASERAGDVAAAAAVRRRYGDVLAAISS
jgi:DNA-binding SARP family transcriptional activator